MVPGGELARDFVAQRYDITACMLELAGTPTPIEWAEIQGKIHCPFCDGKRSGALFGNGTYKCLASDH